MTEIPVTSCLGRIHCFLAFEHIQLSFGLYSDDFRMTLADRNRRLGESYEITEDTNNKIEAFVCTMYDYSRI